MNSVEERGAHKHSVRNNGDISHSLNAAWQSIMFLILVLQIALHRIVLYIYLFIFASVFMEQIP